MTRTLLTCGYNVGTFTSPYIERYQNRIQFNGVDIDDDSLLKMSNKIKPIFDELATSPLGAPTIFEISATLSILYFAEITKPDFIVWETGLGGRLDSTNVVTPIITVITNVGHDHMELLGDSLAQVAAEKAGIIKSGIPVISAVEQSEAIEVIRKVASEHNSRLYLLNEQFHFESLRSELNLQTLNFYGPFQNHINIDITLNGAHQQKNAAVTLMTLEVLRQLSKVELNNECIFEGMRMAQWPGRLEIVSQSPRILLDGAHNPEGAATLAEALRTIYTYDRLHLMIAMMPTKKHKEVLQHLIPLANIIIVTEPEFFKKAEAEALSELVKEVAQESANHPEIVVEKEWIKALSLLKKNTRAGDLAVVTGTLYLISDVRSMMLYGNATSDKGL